MKFISFDSGKTVIREDRIARLERRFREGYEKFFLIEDVNGEDFYHMLSKKEYEILITKLDIIHIW